MATFVPIRDEDPALHAIHTESFRVGREAVDAIETARRRGSRVVAVGTTTVRALETAAGDGTLQPMDGESHLYIRPGHRFRVIDVLMTNFHAPRSTLLMLLAAAMGSRWRSAYQEALAHDYRFLSLGDAMVTEVRRGPAVEPTLKVAHRRSES